jgi:hypothetical protein
MRAAEGKLADRSANRQKKAERFEFYKIKDISNLGRLLNETLVRAREIHEVSAASVG